MHPASENNPTRNCCTDMTSCSYCMGTTNCMTTIDAWGLLCPDADRARKHGLDEFVLANPCNFSHSDLFKVLQTLTLDYRLGDAYTCLVLYQIQNVPFMSVFTRLVSAGGRWTWA